jgi:hypothetical protein
MLEVNNHTEERPLTDTAAIVDLAGRLRAEDAAAAAHELIAAATSEADAIRAEAHRDAEDMITIARSQIKRERVIAEGRAAERIDAAEHEALEIRRNAWARAQAEIEHQASDHRCHEREHLAFAISALQQARQELDDVAAAVASGSAHIDLTIATLQSLLPLESDPIGRPS